MKLLRLRADGFATLSGEYLFDPERLTLVVENNERGKSTLLSAVSAALYGLADDRRGKRTLTPLERYRPWRDPDRYAVELDIECNGERYRIQRDFARGHVLVQNRWGQDVTVLFRKEKDYSIGEVLLGLAVEEFEKCAFVRQGAIEQVVPSEERDRRLSTLHVHLENAADTRGGDTSATEALRVLRKAAESYLCPDAGDNPIKIENVIRRLEVLTGDRDIEIGALETRLGAAASRIIELDRLSARERELEQALEELRGLRRAAIAGEARRRLDEDAGERRRLATFEAEAHTLEPLAAVPVGIAAEARAAVVLMSEAELQVARDEERASKAAADLAAAARAVNELEGWVARGLHGESLAPRLPRPSSEEAPPRDRRSQPGTLRAAIATIEGARSEGARALKSANRRRLAWLVPGIVVVLLGAAAGTLAALPPSVFASSLPPELLALIGGGAAILGIAAIVMGTLAGNAGQRVAATQIAEANERLAALEAARRESENRLEVVASNAERDLEASNAMLIERRAHATEMLRAAGVPAPDDATSWAEAVAVADERERGARRHAQLVGDAIPGSRARLLDARSIADLEARVAAFLSEGQTLDPERTPNLHEIERMGADMRTELDRARRSREQLEQEVADALRRFPREHAEALSKREHLGRVLERAHRFKSSVELACTTIEEVARDTHRRWAEFLDHRVTELLQAMGSPIRQVRFGDDLDFTIAVADSQTLTRAKAVMQLSAGARDQIHFAVRLAISEFLGRGAEPVPFLIDDCFATSDDERTEAGMRLLIEQFSPRHQVVMTTCHRRRFEALASRDPGLYARVQWLDLDVAAAQLAGPPA